MNKGNQEERESKREEIFYIKGTGRSYQPGRGLILHFPAECFYERNSKVIIKKMPDGSIGREEGDPETIELLERLILNPRWQVKELSGNGVIEQFDRLLKLIERKRKLDSTSRALSGHIEDQFELMNQL